MNVERIRTADAVAANGDPSGYMGEIDPATVEPLPTVSLADFVAHVDDAAADPLVGDRSLALIPYAGLVVIAGRGGSGKTTFSFDAVAHFCSATPWFGMALGRPLRVLMIEVEGPREPFRQKLEHKANVWPGEPFRQNVQIFDPRVEGGRWGGGSFSFADPRWRARLRRRILDDAIDVVFGNPVRRLGMAGGGTPDEVGAFVSFLQLCGLGVDVAFWLIHHFNRSLSRDVLDRLSGAFDADADTIIGLHREPGETKSRLTWAKVRGALGVAAPSGNVDLEWNVETVGFTVAEPHDTTEPISRAAIREGVLEHLDRTLAENDPGALQWQSTTEVRANVKGRNEIVDELLLELAGLTDGSETVARVELSPRRAGATPDEVAALLRATPGDKRRPRYWRRIDTEKTVAPNDGATPGDLLLFSSPDEGAAESPRPYRDRGDERATPEEAGQVPDGSDDLDEPDF